MARHIIMDSSGHSTIEFDKPNAADLAEAERRFRKLTAKGFLAAEQKGGGQHRISEGDRKFDPLDPDFTADDYLAVQELMLDRMISDGEILKGQRVRFSRWRTRDEDVAGRRKAEDRRGDRGRDREANRGSAAER